MGITAGSLWITLEGRPRPATSTRYVDIRDRPRYVDL